MLGGGGEYFAAWMLGFMHGLHENGVGYEMPDVIIGTSAGSVVGSTIAGGHLAKLTRDFDFFGAFPKLLGALVPTPTPNPSQIRAHDLCNSATNSSLETIQAIGRGAMAARNPSVGKLQDMVIALTGNVHWPSDIFHATTMDCYTGERLVVSSNSNVHISHAVSSSMSLPGIFGPTWVGDRVCMDGGMSPSSTHSDLVAGAKRAIVVSLTDGLPGSGPRFSSMPNYDPAGNQGSGGGRHQGAADLGQPRQGQPRLARRDRPGHEARLRPRRGGSCQGQSLLGLSVNANWPPASAIARVATPANSPSSGLPPSGA